MTYHILCVISLAKPRCSGRQTRWTCELSGLCKVYNPQRWPAEGAVLFRPIMWLYSASVVLVWDSFLPFTLPWPYSSKVHLVLATALKETTGRNRFGYFLSVMGSPIPYTPYNASESVWKPLHASTPALTHQHIHVHSTQQRSIARDSDA